jgi:hypothetical protein
MPLYIDIHIFMCYYIDIARVLSDSPLARFRHSTLRRVSHEISFSVDRCNDRAHVGFVVYRLRQAGVQNHRNRVALGSGGLRKGHKARATTTGQSIRQDRPGNKRTFRPKLRLERFMKYSP